MKNRKREYCTSGSVRGEGGNILTYSAAWRRGGVAARGAGAAARQIDVFEATLAVCDANRGFEGVVEFALFAD